MIQAGGIISVDEMYKKLFDRVVVDGDLGGLPAIEQFDPCLLPALLSVPEVKSKERVMYNGSATEDASRASILATEVSALRKAHSKRVMEAVGCKCECVFSQQRQQAVQATGRRESNRKKKQVIASNRQQGSNGDLSPCFVCVERETFPTADGLL